MTYKLYNVKKPVQCETLSIIYLYRESLELSVRLNMKNYFICIRDFKVV